MRRKRSARVRLSCTERQPVAPCAGAARRSECAGRGRGVGRVRSRHAGSGVPRLGIGAGRARPRAAGSTCISPPNGCMRTTSRSPRASDCRRRRCVLPRRRRRGVRRPRGHLHAGPRMTAGAAYRAAGEDGVRAGGVVLRARAPAPGETALPNGRTTRRRARQDARRASCSRRRVHVQLPAVCATRHAGIGPYRVPKRRDGAWASRTPTTRRAARCAGSARCRHASATSRTWTAWPQRSGWTRWSFVSATPLRPATRCRPDRSVDGPAPVAQLLRLVASRRYRKPATDDLRQMPGGVSNTTHGEGVVRGVGYGVSIKNVGFSEGFDDYATARVRLHLVGGSPAVVVHTAAAEVGQGLVTVQAQIARTELGVDQVTVAVADTSVGSAGSTSASRQTYMTGGAVRAACVAVRERVLSRVGGAQWSPGPSSTISASRSSTLQTCSATRRSKRRCSGHRPTEALDRRPGRAAHRAVRVRRAPRDRGRGHRVGARPGGRDRHRTGRRQGGQPAGRAGPDPRRYGPGPGIRR